MELRSAECIVRPYRPEDAESLARHGNNRRIWLNLRDRFPHPFSVEDGAAYIAYTLREPVPLSFAIDVGGEAVGGISLHPGEDVERYGAELGYWLGESMWGRGVTTAAVRLVTAYAFAERGLLRVFALPFTRNAASVRVLEKAGYIREGHLRGSAVKDGELLDQYLYAKLGG
ncbi:MAG TPA: GNAT family protein [Gemmatimonadaceae bacterium]|jgi:Acetyltransferases, including N-acetylases of ribosomal proteins